MASRPDRTRTARRTGPARSLAGLAVAVVLAGALGACGSDAGSDGAAPAEKTEIEGITRPEPLQVGDQALPQVAPDGSTTPFAFKASDGKLLFVAFGYTNCPDVCPTTLYDIKKAKKQLGTDGERIEVAFATVDPNRDTPEVMNDYLGSFVDDGHPLRTEDPAELKAVEDVFGISSQVVEQPDGRIDVAHTARSFVIDDQGEVVVEWAFGTGPDAMAGDLAILLDRQAEAS